MLLKSYLGGMVVLGAGALALALLAMVAVSPTTLGPLGVTAWFLVVLAGLTGILSVAAYAACSRLQPQRSTRLRIFDSWRRGLLVGGLATMVLALNSLQQLNARAVILLVALGVLTEFYAVARS